MALAPFFSFTVNTALLTFLKINVFCVYWLTKRAVLDYGCYELATSTANEVAFMIFG